MWLSGPAHTTNDHARRETSAVQRAARIRGRNRGRSEKQPSASMKPATWRAPARALSDTPACSASSSAPRAPAVRVG